MNKKFIVLACLFLFPYHSFTVTLPDTLDSSSKKQVSEKQVSEKQATKKVVKPKKKHTLEHFIGFTANFGIGMIHEAPINTAISPDVFAISNPFALNFFYEFRVDKIFSIRTSFGYDHSWLMKSKEKMWSANFNTNFGIRFYIASPFYIGTGFGIIIAGLEPNMDVGFGAPMVYAESGYVFPITKNFGIDFGLRYNAIWSSNIYKIMSNPSPTDILYLTHELSLHFGFNFQV